MRHSLASRLAAAYTAVKYAAGTEMSTGDALLAAVKAAPHDDLPRLVYADWLEENGREDEAASARQPTTWQNVWERAAALDSGLVMINAPSGDAVAAVLVPRYSGPDDAPGERVRGSGGRYRQRGLHRFLHYREHPAVLAALQSLPPPQDGQYTVGHSDRSHAAPKL